MFDTTLLVKFSWYSFRQKRLQYRYSDTNLRGDKVFVFRTERGAEKIISQTIVQRELKEAIATPAPVVMRAGSGKPQRGIASTYSTHDCHYTKEILP